MYRIIYIYNVLYKEIKIVLYYFEAIFLHIYKYKNIIFIS